MMTLSDFAGKYGLRIERFKEDDGENYLPRILRGRPDLTHIYEWSDSQFAVMFCTDGQKAPRTGLWKRFQERCLAASMVPHQVGDAEGSFLFNPRDDKQAKAAIAAAKARKKRQISPEQRTVLAGVLAAARSARASSGQQASIS
jgi:hypothetical protein